MTAAVLLRTAVSIDTSDCFIGYYEDTLAGPIALLCGSYTLTQGNAVVADDTSDAAADKTAISQHGDTAISGPNYLLLTLPNGQSIRGTGQLRKLRNTAITPRSLWRPFGGPY